MLQCEIAALPTSAEPVLRRPISGTILRVNKVRAAMVYQAGEFCDDGGSIEIIVLTVQGKAFDSLAGRWWLSKPPAAKATLHRS